VRAAVLSSVDGPFELLDVPDPAGERTARVLVRVRAVGINYAHVLRAHELVESRRSAGKVVLIP